MKIYYGYQKQILDVTSICEGLSKNNILCIPEGDDKRVALFSDPAVGIPKKIYIDHQGMHEYDEDMKLYIDLIHLTTHMNEFHTKLRAIHASLRIQGPFEELSQQKMVVRYLKGHEKILEIGGNVGRTSLVMASLLKDSRQLVTLESNPLMAAQLMKNRDVNGFHFYVEPYALSTRKMIQMGEDTLPSETLPLGYRWVHTMTLEELYKKYTGFDTLVVDCGAFYYLVMDMPQLLSTMKTIIKNKEMFHLQYVNGVLKKYGFMIESENNLFEVWKK